MIKVVARLVLRNIARFHYESAEAQLLAFEDVMKGPAFFRDNLDMSQRRADIKALMREEIWRDIENPVVHSLPKKNRVRAVIRGLLAAQEENLRLHTECDAAAAGAQMQRDAPERAAPRFA